MDIPAAHNDAQGLSVMRSAPKLRPRTPMSGLVLPSCAQRRPWPAQAGTGTCVHIPIQLIPIASLAWLGKQQPCPLLSVGCMGLLETECDTHTHTHSKDLLKSKNPTQNTHLSMCFQTKTLNPKIPNPKTLRTLKTLKTLKTQKPQEP